MSSHDFRDVQMEFLSPAEIDAALDARSLVYIPLGAVEFHAAHLPVGLDALVAHGVCQRAAAARGGLVYPPLFHGTGGGHLAYPWTIMMEDGAEITAIVGRTLERLEEHGVGKAVLVSGHFADEQIAMIRTIEVAWRSRGSSMEVRALGMNMAGTAIEADHAGPFETSLLFALWPDRVHLEALPPLDTTPSPDPGGDTRGQHRHDPTHPLHGVFGGDPRTIDTGRAQELLDEVAGWLAEKSTART